MNKYFNFYRIYLLIKRQIQINLKTFWVSAGAITGILFMLYFLTSLESKDLNEFFQGFYTFVLFLGGYIITSSVFKDMQSPERGYSYLLLPASTFEKFLSKLLLTTIGWIVSITVLYYIFSLFAGVFNVIIFKREFITFNPFNYEILRGIVIYIVTQSIFFLGAIYFKKNAFLKTNLLLCLCFVYLLLFLHCCEQLISFLVCVALRGSCGVSY